MAEIAKVNGVAALDIAKVHGVAAASIAKVSGVDLVLSTYADTKSAQFDGSNERVDFGTSACDEDGTDEFTISAWIKTSSTGTWKGILSKVSQSGQYRGWTFALTTANPPVLGLFVYTDDSNYYNMYATAGHDFSTWHHVMATYNGTWGTGCIKLYIDNVDVTGSEPILLTQGTTSNSGNLFISAQRNDTYFNGVLGDIAKIPWVLSSDERAEIYNSGKGFDFTSFSGWSTMKADARSLWITWEADDVTTSNGVVDLTDNGYTGSGANMESGDIVSDAP